MPPANAARLSHAFGRRELHDLFHRIGGDLLLRLVLERLPVERVNVLAHALVKPFARLGAVFTLLHQLGHPRRHRKIFAGGLREPGSHMRERVEA